MIEMIFERFFTEFLYCSLYFGGVKIKYFIVFIIILLVYVICL